MKKLFLLSGLGADKRVFDFLDLCQYEPHHVIWVAHVPYETITEYAKRLLPQITGHKPVLIGVSFGGMIALEMAKFIEVEKVILISSALTPQAIPPYFKMMSKLKIQRWVSPSTMKRPNELLYWLFGISQREHKNLLASIMNDTDVSFFLWAIESIMLWKGKSCTGAVIQIHGTKDRILNFKTADYAIAGGGHLMIITKAREVSDILKQVLV